MQRVETYVLKKTSSTKDEYQCLVDLCHKSKNLYNYANYIVRQTISGNLQNIPEYADLVKTSIKTVTSKKDGSHKTYQQNFISEFDLSKRMAALKQVDYKALKAQCSQQTIALLFKNYKSFYKASSDYYVHTSKYRGRPKLPKYKDKDGLSILIYTSQSAKINEHGNVQLAKDFILKSVKTSFVENDQLRQVRIVPKLDYFQIEIVYEKKESEYARRAKLKNTKIHNAAIDIGVGNLATTTLDDKRVYPLIINGRPLKSINQFYNKKLAKLQAEYSSHSIHTGHKLRQLNIKRSMKIKDYMHKASRRIIDFCILNNVKTLFIGHNNGWKQNASMSKNSNQNFVQIPFNMLIRMIQYKADEVGIEVKLVNEAYTSKCSFLDNEEVEFHSSYAGQRLRRGLFKTNNGRCINADVNGSLNILKTGLGHSFNVNNSVFNPQILNNVNEIYDVACLNGNQQIEVQCLSQIISL